MRRTASTIYAIFCTLLLVAGLGVGFYFAWQRGVYDVAWYVAGFAVGFVLSPTLHELGHIVFAKANGMRLVYAKFFCCKLVLQNGKLRKQFASPFAPDETQVVPKFGGNMQKRAVAYTLGGVVFSGLFFLALTITALLLTVFFQPVFLLWGCLPYATYLFLLNVAPCTYASGKTDTLIYIGIKKGEPAEKNMLSAMEIQGELYAGKSFAEIDERLYFDNPVLCEDEPLFAVTCDLQYRYFLEKEDFQSAGERLNRLAQIQPYLSALEVEKLAGELVYMHALGGDVESAQESGKYCQNYLSSDEVSAKRILATFAYATGKKEETEILLRQAERALDKEIMLGVAKFEKILLSRIEKAKSEENNE